MHEITIKKKFNLENSLKAIIQRLRISKQKTIITTPFEAHFGRKCNTPISNITTKPNRKNYNAILNYYLDEKTIPGRSYMSEEQWADTALCSDTEIERVMCAASALARAEQEKRKDGEERFLNSERLVDQFPARNAVCRKSWLANCTKFIDRRKIWMGFMRY